MSSTYASSFITSCISFIIPRSATLPVKTISILSYLKWYCLDILEQIRSLTYLDDWDCLVITIVEVPNEY